jgi:hypothetical protein
MKNKLINNRKGYKKKWDKLKDYFNMKIMMINDLNVYYYLFTYMFNI